MYDLLNWGGIRKISYFWQKKGRVIFTPKGFDNSVVSFSSTFLLFSGSSGPVLTTVSYLPQWYTLACNHNGKHSSEVNWKNQLSTQYGSRVACQGTQKAYRKCLNSSIGTSALEKFKSVAGRGPLCSPVNRVLAGRWASYGPVVCGWLRPFSNLCLSCQPMKRVGFPGNVHLNAAQKGEEGATPWHATSDTLHWGGWLPFDHGFAQTSYPSQCCLPPACSLFCLHHGAPLLGSSLHGQLLFGFGQSISEAHRVIQHHRVRLQPQSLTSPLHLVPRSLISSLTPTLSSTPYQRSSYFQSLFHVAQHMAASLKNTAPSSHLVFTSSCPQGSFHPSNNLHDREENGDQRSMRAWTHVTSGWGIERALLVTACDSHGCHDSLLFFCFIAE